MDIRELRCIVRVADAGSFSRAAEQLFVTRQAVAKTLASVEAETGMEVFVREGGRLVPTERGADFVADARRVIALFDEAIGPYLELPDYGRGTSRGRQAPPAYLRVSLVTGGARWALPPHFFEEVRSTCPRAVLAVEEMNSDAVVTSVAHGDVDLGIAVSHPELSAGLERRLLVRGGLWLFMSAENPLADRCALEVHDLEGQPLVTGGPHDHSHRFILGRCRDAGVHPRLVGNATDADTIAQLMSESGALCPMVDPTEIELPAGRVVRPLVLPGSELFGTYVLRRRAVAPSPEAARVWDAWA